MKLRQQIQEARTADARRRPVANGLIVEAAGAQVGELLNRAGPSPHAVADTAAFKSRTGGTGDAHQPVAIAQNDLAIGADVCQQADPRLGEHTGREYAADDVAAHVGGHARQAVEQAPLADLDSDLGGPDRGHEVRRGDIGLAADSPGVEIQQEVNHRRVAGADDRGDFLQIDPLPHGHGHHQAVEVFDGAVLQLVEGVVLFRVNDPPDIVFTEVQLAVVRRLRVERGAGRQVYQVGHHGRGA